METKEILRKHIAQAASLSDGQISNADSLAPLHLVDRIGETSDVAELALYLAGSNFVTGEIINLDGGHVAGHHLG